MDLLTLIFTLKTLELMDARRGRACTSEFDYIYLFVINFARQLIVFFINILFSAP